MRIWCRCVRLEEDVLLAEWLALVAVDEGFEYSQLEGLPPSSGFSEGILTVPLQLPWPCLVGNRCGNGTERVLEHRGPDESSSASYP